MTHFRATDLPRKLRNAAARRAVLATLLAVATAEPVHAAGTTLPVPSAAIYPGDKITDKQLTDKAFSSVNTQIAVALGRQELIGKVARRTLLPGRPIPMAAVRDAELVVVGQPVTASFAHEGLTILGRAMPLQSGKAGDVIALRNLDSGLTFKGLVEADGTIRVEPR